MHAIANTRQAKLGKAKQDQARQNSKAVDDLGYGSQSPGPDGVCLAARKLIIHAAACHVIIFIS